MRSSLIIYEVVDNYTLITKRLFSSLKNAIEYVDYNNDDDLLVYETVVDSDKYGDWSIVYRSSNDG